MLSHLAEHPRFWAGLVFVATLTSTPFLLETRVDNTIEVWIDREGAAFRGYQDFVQRFGSEEFILIAYRMPTNFSEDFLLRLTDLRLSLEEVSGVRQVHCLSGIYATFFGPAGPQGFFADVKESPFYRSFLVSPDLRIGGIWVQLSFSRPAERAALVRSVHQTVTQNPLGTDTHLAGSPVVNEALDTASRRSSRTFFPLVFVLSGVVLLARFRRFYGVVIPFLSVGSGIAVTLAALTASGHSLNMVTVALPPVVWVLGLSTSIHLLSAWSRRLQEGGEGPEAILGALRSVSRPCLFSALTTALGFLALRVSSMQPVQEMGLFAALGVISCLTTNLLLFPFLVGLWTSPGLHRQSRVDNSILRRLAGFCCRKPRRVAALAATLTAIMAVATAGLRVESNVLSFFKPDAPISIAYREILDGFTGPYSLEILVRPGSQESSQSTLRELDALGAVVADQPGVARVLSAADLIKKVFQVRMGDPASSYRLPSDDEELALAWELTRDLLYPELASLFDANSGTFRLSALVRTMASGEHRQLVESLQDLLHSEALASWQPRLTGIVDLLVAMQSALIESQIRSFGLAFLMIVPVMAILLRSARLALISLVPNLLPVLSALGVMGAADIPLDPATVMIAALALGIAVDDSIHLLVSYRQRRDRGLNTGCAIEEALTTVGRPIALTSLVAALGFLVLCFADFVPLIHFGLLTAVTLVAALVADLFLLPALLVLFDTGRIEIP